MDQSERIVEKYLQSLELGTIVFEPDGNVPPDFSIGGMIGVEVRRLNQNYHLKDSRTEGLEQVAIPLWQRTEKYFPAIGKSIDGESWYVTLIYKRPQIAWKIAEPIIRRELFMFMNAQNRQPITIRINDTLQLKLRRAGKDQGSFFLLGSSLDRDSGGWVLSEVETNLMLCVAEKARKVSPYRSRYASWWLILVDHIALGVRECEQERFRASLVVNAEFSAWGKVILIDPRDHCRAFEIWPRTEC
ncbi:hypothetical protein [Massilia polaris]|nr:hypothetical protein [Massilia polaris]